MAVVEPVDRVMQPRMRVDVATAWQRIVDVLGPAFFFKRAQYQLLNWRRHSEPLDDRAVNGQLAPPGIPAWL
jgi:hypothetical protein